jgi:hypothetical protein
MLKLETKDDLDRLIVEGIKESLTLDYKASPALGKGEKQRDELCKDVTAFANSAGGQIVYGVEEDKHVPTKVDDGTDPVITKEWVEQVIDSRVQQRIEGLAITPIQLAKGLGFVITIPQATSRAPRQAPDKRYYKRQNFQSVAMEDYEIRDALRRATTPDLFVTLSFEGGDRARFDYPPHQEISKPVRLLATIANRSPQPAQHTIVRIGVPENIKILGQAKVWGSPVPGNDESGRKIWLMQRISTPPDFPIFKEIAQPLDGEGIFLGFHSNFLTQTYRWPITITIHTPGFSLTETWFIQQEGTNLRLLHPSHPLLR